MQRPYHKIRSYLTELGYAMTHHPAQLGPDILEYWGRGPDNCVLVYRLGTGDDDPAEIWRRAEY